MDIAVLGIKVDTSQVRSASRELDNLTRSGARAEKATEGITSGFINMRAAVATLGIGYVFREMMNATDSVTKLNAQLRIATGSLGQYRQAQQDVLRISETAQADLNATAQLYARLIGALKDTTTTQGEIANITETVSLALKANGATAQETASAILQLSQAFGSGKLQGEEFRALMEAAPNLMRALAESINVPVGKLKDLASEGQLTAEVLAKAFKDESLLAKMQEQGKQVQTISGSYGVLKNQVTLLIGELNEAQGAGWALAQTLDLVSKGVERLREDGGRRARDSVVGLIPGLQGIGIFGEVSSFMDQSGPSASGLIRRPKVQTGGVAAKASEKLKTESLSITVAMQEENLAAQEQAEVYAQLLNSTLSLANGTQTAAESLQDQLDAISKLDPATRNYVQSVINAAKAQEQWSDIQSLQNEAEAESLAEIERQSGNTADEVERFKERSYRAWLDLLPAADRLQLELDELYMTAARLGLDKSWADNIAEKMKQSAKAAEDAGNEMTKFMKRAAENMQDAMANGFFDIMQGNFDDLEQTFKRTIDRMVAELLASRLNNELFGAEFSKTGEFGGIIGKAGDWLGDLFGGFFANGGMPPMGKVSVVGENGPELFVPKSAGTIIPNNQIKQGNTQISVVINAKDIGSFRHSEPQIAAQMQRALNRARRVM